MEMPFKAMMRELVVHTPGARGAIFVDWEGEAVDQYSSDNEDYQLKVMGAYKGVILSLINDVQVCIGGGEVECVMVRMEEFSILMTPVKDGYYVALVMGKGSILSRAAFGMKKVVKELMSEM